MMKRMKNKIRYGLIVFFGVVTISCNSQTTKNRVTKEIKSEKSVSISKEQASNIFKDIVRIEPINCLVVSLDNKEIILCLANKTGIENNNKMFYSNPEIVFYKLSKFANTWRIEFQKTIIKEEFSYCEFYNDFDIIKIEDKSYLYFLYDLSPMGNAVNYVDLNFALLSLKDYKLTELDYGGEPNYDKNDNLKYIKGDFTNLDKLSSKPDILKFLENKAGKSSLIYRATKKDLDMNNADNYEKKWQIDNSKIKDVFSVMENTLDVPLKTTYYEQNIFPSDQNYISSKIENSKFRIISLFRNNILGFDKTKKKFFPIWVETCMHGCNKEIKFINSSTLQITYSEANNEKIIVDLSKMTYNIILK